MGFRLLGHADEAEWFTRKAAISHQPSAQTASWKRACLTRRSAAIKKSESPEIRHSPLTNGSADFKRLWPLWSGGLADLIRATKMTRTTC